MPHVEDALLVAYADDALDAAGRAEVETHLVSCAECRARAAEERALAARAAEVLGRGAPEPGMAAPPFAEIVRRSEQVHATPGGGATGAPQRRRTLPPLAWAAMLVVGLGAAWIARTLLVSPAFNAPADAIRAERMESTAAEAAPTEPPATGAAGDAAGAPEEADARKAAVAADASLADETREAAAAPAAGGQAVEPVRVAPQAIDAPPPPAPQAAEAPVPLGEPVSRRYADAAVRDSAQRGDTARVALRAAAAAPAAAAAAPAPAAERAEAVADGAMRDVDPGDAAWVGASAADAAARGEAVRGIMGAPVELVWLGRPDASWRARVVQRVDGAALEVIEWRTAPAPAGASGTLDDGRGYLFTTSAGTSVLLRGRISPDRLRVLAERLTRLP